MLVSYISMGPMYVRVKVIPRKKIIEAEKLGGGITFYILELPHKHMAGPVHQNRNDNPTAVQVSQDQLQTF